MSERNSTRLSAVGRRLSASERGYTAVEVLVATTLLIIGAAGVVSMQRAAIEGNVQARRLDTANGIARLWIERFRTDASMWTLPNKYNATDNRTVSNTPLLATVDSDSASATWRIVTDLASTPIRSNAFDVAGNDLDPSVLDDPVKSVDVMFCVNVRLSWLVTNELIRAEVRVIWRRDDGADSPKFLTEVCKNTSLPPELDTATNNYHFVYATTAVRRNEFYNR